MANFNPSEPRDRRGRWKPYPVAVMRAINDRAFQQARFLNKIANIGDPKAKFKAPFPGIDTPKTSSQTAAMMRAGLKIPTNITTAQALARFLPPKKKTPTKKALKRKLKANTR